MSEDAGGSQACWLHRVCSDCGRFEEDARSDTCSHCGRELSPP